MWVGIDLGLEYSRYSILDDGGELLEHGSVRSTDPGLRGRFSALEPSLIAASFHDGMSWALSLLAGLGHSVLVAGSLDEALRSALAPLIELPALQSGTAEEQRTFIFRRSGEAAEAGVMFMVTVEDLLGRLAVSDAWYFVGPLDNGMRLSDLRGVSPQSGQSDGACAAERALRLHQLWEMGEVSLPRDARIVAA